MTERPLFHWNYFISLEQDLINLSKYIEICPENFAVHSNEILKLFLTVCAEIDSIAKQICKLEDKANMQRYKEYFSKHYPDIVNRKIFLHRYRIDFKPWQNIESQLPWWKAYTDVKHHRHKNFHQANLGNLLAAMSGNLLLLIYYYESDYFRLDPPTQVFVPEKELGYVSSALESPTAFFLARNKALNYE